MIYEYDLVVFIVLMMVSVDIHVCADVYMCVFTSLFSLSLSLSPTPSDATIPQVSLSSQPSSDDSCYHALSCNPPRPNHT